MSDINSDDSGDEDEDTEPKKPVPLWAQDNVLRPTAQQQQLAYLNFTKMFKAATREELNLDKIFKSKKNKNFQVRSSSAHWTNSPIWNTSGLNGEGSFMVARYK